MQVKLHNHFKIYTENVKTKEVALAGRAENVVLNRYYTRILDRINLYSARDFSEFGVTSINVGTGTTPPTVEDTSLASYLGNKILENRKWNYIKENKTWEVTCTVTIGATEMNGNTITEIGLSRSSYSSGLITRALIKDAQGNPIGIEKTNDIALNIQVVYYVPDVEYSNIDETPGSTFFDIYWRSRKMDNYRDNLPIYSTLAEIIAYGQTRNITLGGYYTSTCFWLSTLSNQFRGMPETMVMMGGGLLSKAFSDEPLVLDVGDRNNRKFQSYTQFAGYAYQRGPIGACAYKAFKNLPVNAVSLGTGDGVQTKFKMPHVGAHDIQSTVAGNFHLEDTKTGREQVLYNNWQYAMDFYTKDGMQPGSTSVLRDYATRWIPYKDGYFLLSAKMTYDLNTKTGLFNSAQLLGIYMRRVEGLAEPLLEPAVLEIPPELIESSGISNLQVDVRHMRVFASGDSTMIILQGNYSDTKYINCIFSYNAANGTINKLLFTNNWTNLIFNSSMTKCLARPSDGATGTVQVYNIQHSAEALILEAADIIPLPNKTDFTKKVSLCTYDSEFVDGYFHAYTGYSDSSSGRMHRYKIDWTSNVISQETIEGCSSIGITENYFVQLDGQNANVYAKSNPTQIIFTYDLSTILVVTTRPIKEVALYEYQDELFIVGYSWSNNNTDRIFSNSFLWLIKQGEVWEVESSSSLNATIANENIESSVTTFICRDQTLFDKTIMIRQPDIPRPVGYPRCSTSGDSSSMTAIVHYFMYGVLLKTPKEQYLVFDTPPTAGADVNVSYQLDYFPKDENWTASFAPKIGLATNA